MYFATNYYILQVYMNNVHFINEVLYFFNVWHFVSVEKWKKDNVIKILENHENKKCLEYWAKNVESLHSSFMRIIEAIFHQKIAFF